MLTQEDKELLAKKGISEQQIQEQLACFEQGFPFLKLAGAAAVDNGGIFIPTADEQAAYLAAWDAYKDGDKKVVKFVPASGAASRMFKNMFEFLGADYDVPTTDFEKKFFDHIHSFAFFNDLNAACLDNTGKTIDALVEEKNYKAVVANLLEAAGLNYGALPKGLLKFHRYEDGVRTPLEEHLVEGALYAAGKTGQVNVHFTVSTEHRALFAKLVEAKVAEYAQKYGVEYNISFSEQKPSTDTMAATMDNQPFRDEKGKLVFRPGGHGALIENLNDLDADIVFIKNIDNVVPSKFRATTTKYKRVIAGYLVEIQAKVAAMLQKIEAGECTEKELKPMLAYLENELSIHSDKTAEMDKEQLCAYIKAKLNRPIRVCGVVKNEGEPGGGPYLAYNPDGTYSPQILESAQIDSSNPDAVALMNSGTHFNPVDLVCYLKDYKGEKFNLKEFVDLDTGLISMKSKNGVDIKALELPGLWNGSMSDWITVFVEVPIETFNPVKTVNDLLRPEHQ